MRKLKITGFMVVLSCAMMCKSGGICTRTFDRFYREICFELFSVGQSEVYV